jgi:transcription initiation factor TFIIE subunit alpha
MALKKEIEYIISETFGPGALPIALYLNGKENISEFVIANDLSIEIHRARQILYKLLEDNIVIFIRKKDKLKGWYICYWSLNEVEFQYIIRKIKKNKLNKLKTRLEQETNEDFYMCKNACTRMDFDNSFEINFKCPDCGEIMHLQSSKRTIQFLKEKVAKLEKETEIAIQHPKQKEEVKPKIKEKITPKQVKKPAKKSIKRKKTSTTKPKKVPKKKKSPTKKKQVVNKKKSKKKGFSLFKKKK